MLTIKEKAGYGLGDTASNLIFQTIIAFLGYYYIEIVGLSAAAVGTMFLVVRWMDAITDPIMGTISDHTNTRWGRYRPYLIWLCVPFGLSAVLAFSIPSLSQASTLVYAYVSYALMMLMYTAINIPYCALGAAMTSDPAERLDIQSWRFAGGQTGNLIVTSCTLPLVAYFGAGDDGKGYQATMMLFAVLAIMMFLICFASTKERVVEAPVSGEKSNFFMALLKNDQAMVLAALNFFILVALVLRGTVTLFYVNDVLEQETLATAFLTLGAIAAIIGSIIAGQLAKGFNVRSLAILAIIQVLLLLLFLFTKTITVSLFWVALAGCFIGVLFGVVLERWFPKTRAFTVCFMVIAALHFCLYAIDPANTELCFFIFVLLSLVNQIAIPILWSMMADSVDYGEFKTGQQATGLIFSGILFALKMGVAVGGAVAAWLLAFYGYESGVEQSAATREGIAILFTLVPGAVSLIVVLVTYFYSLDDQRMRQIHRRLESRRMSQS